MFVSDVIMVLARPPGQVSVGLTPLKASATSAALIIMVCHNSPVTQPRPHDRGEHGDQEEPKARRGFGPAPHLQAPLCVCVMEVVQVPEGTRSRSSSNTHSRPPTHTLSVMNRCLRLPEGQVLIMWPLTSRRCLFCSCSCRQ